MWGTLSHSVVLSSVMSFFFKVDFCMRSSSFIIPMLKSGRSETLCRKSSKISLLSHSLWQLLHRFNKTKIKLFEVSYLPCIILYFLGSGLFQSVYGPGGGKIYPFYRNNHRKVIWPSFDTPSLRSIYLESTYQGRLYRNPHGGEGVQCTQLP